MTQAARKPVVLLPACIRQPNGFMLQVGRKYLDAVRLAGALPLLVAAAHPDEIDALLDLADGVLLTGSASNVHPRHFDEGVHDPALPLDPERDAWTLPLIPKVLQRGLPLLAICRGAQEVNVALGGSLHQAVHELAPYLDHRAADDEPTALQYGPAHEVELVPGGCLSRLIHPARFRVNSVHAQAVNRLAPGLQVEACAPDGLVEAFSMQGARGFNLCVQWHPEWQAADNPQSMQMLRAFGAACRDYRDRRCGP